MDSGLCAKGVVARRMVIAGLLSAFLAGAEAADVDLSCVSHSVRGKTPLTDRFKEYDIVMANRCPGAVYWTMCIERLDPYSHKILETLTPSGLLEEEKKSRVNLQMKIGPGKGPQRRYQEFYLNIGYAIEPPAKASCVARKCEPEIQGLRRQIDANLAAWKKTDAELDRRLAAECPESGWGKTEETDVCAAAVRAEMQPDLDRFAQNDKQLREQLGSTDRNACRVHAGDPVDDPEG